MDIDRENGGIVKIKTEGSHELPSSLGEKMDRPRTVEMPDVPEIHELISKCMSEIREGILPVMRKYDINLFVNAYTMTLMSIATFACKNQTQVDETITAMCTCLKENAKKWHDAKAEDEQ